MKTESTERIKKDERYDKDEEDNGRCAHDGSMATAVNGVCRQLLFAVEAVGEGGGTGPSEDRTHGVTEDCGQGDGRTRLRSSAKGAGASCKCAVAAVARLAAVGREAHGAALCKGA